MANSLDDQYKDLLRKVILKGVEKNDRTGTGTKSIFGETIRHDMSNGFPILTTKKVAWKTLNTELKWFLKGDTNIKYLQDNNCYIWDGDYNKSGASDGNLGPIYGYQWRKKSRYGVQKDQIKLLVEGLRNNPDSRRHLVSSWDVMELDHMVLPPCHYAFQCYVADGKLSLLWSQRSADLFLGVPFNISSYGLLLSVLCEETGYKPGELIGSFGDIHLYNNHIEQAKLQLERESFTLPELKLEYKDIYNGEFQAELIGYKSHSAIKAPLSN